MARRKQNIPADTLARARAQVGIDTSAKLPEAVTPEPTVAELMTTTPKIDKARAVETSRRIQDARFERSKKKGEISQEVIKEMLINPTKFPTVEDMRTDYTHVVNDLRNMFLLSLVLIVFLIAIATVLA